MNNRLNFKHPLLVFFLSFVSLQYTYANSSSTSVQAATKHETQHKTELESEAPVKNDLSNHIPEKTTYNLIDDLKSQIQKNPQDIGKIIELASAFFDKGDFEKQLFCCGSKLIS